MAEEEQCDAVMIESRLKEVFTEDPFVAFAKWNGMVRGIDMYVNDISKRAGFIGKGLERFMKIDFINVFPNHVSIARQQLPSILGSADEWTDYLYQTIGQVEGTHARDSSCHKENFDALERESRCTATDGNGSANLAKKPMLDYWKLIEYIACHTEGGMIRVWGEHV